MPAFVQPQPFAMRQIGGADRTARRCSCRREQAAPCVPACVPARRPAACAQRRVEQRDVKPKRLGRVEIWPRGAADLGAFVLQVAPPARRSAQRCRRRSRGPARATRPRCADPTQRACRAAGGRLNRKIAYPADQGPRSHPAPAPDLAPTAPADRSPRCRSSPRRSPANGRAAGTGPKSACARTARNNAPARGSSRRYRCPSPARRTRPRTPQRHRRTNRPACAHRSTDCWCVPYTGL